MVNKYSLGIAQIDIVKPVNYFCQIYRSLIQQKYNIFPVPDRLINDMVMLCTQSNKLVQKTYRCKDLITKYCKNWRYYHTFKYNMQRMLEKNINATITIIKYSNQSDISYLLAKYPPQDLNLNIDRHMPAVAYTYTNQFDVCIAINSNNQTKFGFYKAIQHQLIHWMQVALNAESGMTRGIFNPFDKCIPKEDILFLYNCFKSRPNINTIDYVLSSMEFQAWCANTVQNFEYSGFKIQEFQNIIKNRQLFKQACEINSNNDVRIQLLMFAQICYLASLANSADDRYWYLIQAIKQNSHLV